MGSTWMAGHADVYGVLKDFPAAARLQRSSLPQLKVRGQPADLLTVFKIALDDLDAPANPFFVQPSNPGLPGHPFKVALP